MESIDSNKRAATLIAGYMARAIPWFLSIVLVSILTISMLYLQNAKFTEPDDLTVRRVEISLAPPPPPPPLEMERPTEDVPTPSIDFGFSSDGVAMQYSEKPTLGTINIRKAKKPVFDIKSFDLQSTLQLSFPTEDVENLDEVPRIVSNGPIKFPRTLVKRGIRRIPTTVEIIIDTRGKAYIKNIIDPVYPEMIESIRHWAKKVKFTIPVKNGKAVQANYVYKLVFIYRV
ncbi:MAG: protein TonB [Flavobacteriales bacterium]|jgi:protein TonB